VNVLTGRRSGSASRSNEARPALGLSERAPSCDAIDAPRPATCALCGFRSTDLGTNDLSVALTSLPHWWRQLFHLDHDAVFLRRRLSFEGWSAIEHGAHVGRAIQAKRNLVECVRLRDGAAVDEVLINAPQVGDNGRDPEVVLESLAQASTPMVMLVLGMAPGDWSRVGLRNGSSVDVLELVREAVHEGVHHLRDARKVLVHVGTTPATDSVDTDIWGTAR
jgi:hypothetical protein